MLRCKRDKGSLDKAAERLRLADEGLVMGEGEGEYE
jgi:hypothetical protein